VVGAINRWPRRRRTPPRDRGTGGTSSDAPRTKQGVGRPLLRLLFLERSGRPTKVGAIRSPRHSAICPAASGGQQRNQQDGYGKEQAARARSGRVRALGPAAIHNALLPQNPRKPRKARRTAPRQSELARSRLGSHPELPLQQAKPGNFRVLRNRSRASLSLRGCRGRRASQCRWAWPLAIRRGNGLFLRRGAATQTRVLTLPTNNARPKPSAARCAERPPQPAPADLRNQGRDDRREDRDRPRPGDRRSGGVHVRDRGLRELRPTLATGAGVRTGSCATAPTKGCKCWPS
jgi:hypothetical protein